MGGQVLNLEEHSHVHQIVETAQIETEPMECRATETSMRFHLRALWNN